MEKDFHYCATFAAARYAGFSTADAATIAHAAQYVDDSSLDRLTETSQYNQYLANPDYQVPYHIKKFQPVPTIQSKVELGRLELRPAWTTEDVNKLRHVWTAFHFLPGNYAPNADVRPYGGAKSWDVGIAAFFYDSDAENAFKMVCLPNSRLVEAMVNDLTEHYVGMTNLLHATGIRMHVLADTWAHCYFAGTPQYWVNNAAAEVVSVDSSGKRRPVNWYNVSWLMGASSQGDAEWAITPSAFVVSGAYLGHGRMGSLPDYPWMRYEYRPQWSASPILKDNPADYLRGFSQMAAALRCIREKRPFVAAAASVVPDEVRTKIGRLIELSGQPNIARDEERRVDLWRRELETLELGGIRIGAPPVYDPDAWLNAARGDFDAVTTDYFQFNMAATQHLAFVAKGLKADTGIDLYESNSSLADSAKEMLKKIDGIRAEVHRNAYKAGEAVYDFGKKAGESVYDTGKSVVDTVSRWF